MDKPNKRWKDRFTVSWQPWEINYVAKQVQQERPKVAPRRIREAINAAKTSIQPSEGREKLMKAIDKRLR